jgi:hypothetical protein
MSELEQCMKALEIIGNCIVQKADTGHKSAKILKAMAIARASETPEGAVLARRVIQLHRQNVMKMAYGPVLKSMGLDKDEEELDKNGTDGWPCYGTCKRLSKSDLDDEDATEEDELRRELREIQDREKEITERMRNLHFGGR